VSRTGSVGIGEKARFRGGCEDGARVGGRAGVAIDFGVAEEKELVFDDAAAEVSAFLVEMDDVARQSLLVVVEVIGIEEGVASLPETAAM